MDNKNFIKLFRRKKEESDTNGEVSNGIVNNNEPVNKIEYRASSPDEKALVEVSERVGITFLGEDGNNLMLKVGESTEMFERLQIIEFTSERKRMSIVVRDKDGKVSVI